jgi:hypothetical protein
MRGGHAGRGTQTTHRVNEGILPEEDVVALQDRLKVLADGVDGALVPCLQYHPHSVLEVHLHMVAVCAAHTVSCPLVGCIATTESLATFSRQPTCGRNGRAIPLAGSEEWKTKSGKTGRKGETSGLARMNVGSGRVGGAPRYCCAVRLNLSSAALLCEGANS